MILGSKQIAEQTGLSQAHVRRLLRSGYIKANKIGRTYIVDEKDVTHLKRRRSLNKKDIVDANPEPISSSGQ